MRTACGTGDLAELLEEVGELLAFEELADDEGAAVGGAIDVEDVDDVRVLIVAAASASRWKRESTSRLPGVLGVQHLQREALRADARVAGLVDAAHAAFADDADDRVRLAQRLADELVLRLFGEPLAVAGTNLVLARVPPAASGADLLARACRARAAGDERVDRAVARRGRADARHVRRGRTDHDGWRCGVGGAHRPLRRPPCSGGLEVTGHCG